MTRRTTIAQLLLGLLILTAAPSFSQPAQMRPQLAPMGPRPVAVQGTIEAVDVEQRTVQVRLLRPQQGQASQTIAVPPEAQIYRQAEVTAEDVAVGDVLEIQSSPPQMSDLLAALPNTTFPPRLLSMIGEVIALQPLTLRTASGMTTSITTSISDLAGVELRHWRRVELADLSPGDRLGAVAERGESGLTSSLIQLWPAPTPPARPAPAPARGPTMRGGFPEVEVMGPEDAKVKIVGLVPIVNPCHAATVAALKELYEEHPDDIHLTLVDFQGPDSAEWKQKLDVTCATVEINGQRTFVLEGRTVTFQQREGGTYRPADLKTVVENELAKAE
jgi:hypothetical protein